jgi:hypothetical protein
MSNKHLHTQSAARYKHHMQVKLEYIADIFKNSLYKFDVRSLPRLAGTFGFSINSMFVLIIYLQRCTCINIKMTQNHLKVFDTCLKIRI